MKNIFHLMLVVLLLASCEKTVDLDYKSNRSDVVIEGNVTDVTGPYFVKITKSVGIAETGSYPTIDDALVIVSDDAGNRDTLISKGNGIYSTTTLNGIAGRTYTLRVEVEGQVYLSQSTMPEHVALDSIRIEEASLGGDIEYKLIPVYKDPMEKGNNYRFVLSVNNKLINQHLVLNDEIRNGLVNTLKLEINDDDLNFKPGDLITIEMQCIDKEASMFYTALALMADNGPGGGTTPNNPPNNIANGVLGLFSAHTVETKSTKIP